MCYVLLQKGNEDAIPLYQFEKKGEFHYHTNVYSLGWLNEGVDVIFIQVKFMMNLFHCINLKKMENFIIIQILIHWVG